ncbi:MAG: SMP-30/gluconolactonase/LRE family protein [Verrucomicrobia bacterium]|nr:SMP-30/gluconolactonase/LRE family protein [Verrucomicrobiota bacterium]
MSTAGLDIFHAIPTRLGEGVCWHPSRQTIWWVDILGRRFYEAGPTGTPPRVLECAEMIGAVAPTRSGGLVAALHVGIYLIDPESGAASHFATPADHDTKIFRFNDGKVDPMGRFWAGTMALDERPGRSRLFRIGADRSVAVMREGVSVSNGLAWSPDARTLYYIDSPTRTVQAFAFDLEHGTVGPPRVAVRFAEADGFPDGCTLDAEGHLWIAHWGAAKVTRWDMRSQRLLHTISLPVRNVTSCAFGGPQRNHLFITTAKDEKSASVEPEAGYIFRIDPGTTGPELACFAGG